MFTGNPSYNYGFQEQEKQYEICWSSFKWKNYDPTIRPYEIYFVEIGYEENLVHFLIHSIPKLWTTLIKS